MANDLNLDAGWSIGEEAFAAILADIGEAPRRLVEFGSGLSSIHWALAFPGTAVLTIEHESAWASRLQALVAESGVRNLTIESRRLRWQWHGFAPYRSYEDGGLPAEIDVVIVDGPPSKETRRGREACLYQAMRQLRVGGRLYLDDYGRSEEARIARNWQRRYDGLLEAHAFDVGHGVLRLEKQAHAAARFDFAVWLDATTQAVIWWMTSPWAAFKRLRPRRRMRSLLRLERRRSSP